MKKRVVLVLNHFQVDQLLNKSLLFLKNERVFFSFPLFDELSFFLFFLLSLYLSSLILFFLFFLFFLFGNNRGQISVCVYEILQLKNNPFLLKEEKEEDVHVPLIGNIK